jgi:Mn-dependent DtxR family transcriptional regulator
MSQLLSTINSLVKADLSEVVYQTQKNRDVEPEQVVVELKELEDAGLINVEILVSLTEEGKKCL